MNRLNRALIALSVCGGLLGAANVYAQQAKTEPLKPILSGKFTPPLRGAAEVQYTLPKTVVKGKQVVTTFQVKNTSTAPLAGFTVTETWYDKGRALIPGAGSTFVYKKLFQPQEIIDITLVDEKDSRMDTNPMQFKHANGTVPTPKRVPKF